MEDAARTSNCSVAARPPAADALIFSGRAAQLEYKQFVDVGFSSEWAVKSVAMRGITIIGGLQLAFVVLGWCALGIVLEFHGYPDNNPFVRWSPLAAFMRERGIWFLLVAPVWVGLAAVLEWQEDRFVLNTANHTIGIVFAIGVLAAFLIATFAPYTRLLLILND